MGDDDPIAKAKAIAARLANITSTTSDLLGKRKFDGIADMGRKKKKVYIPVDKFPNVNFIGLLIGPRGSNQKRMEELSGAKILVRGKGSSRVCRCVFLRLFTILRRRAIRTNWRICM